MAVLRFGTSDDKLELTVWAYPDGGMTLLALQAALVAAGWQTDAVDIIGNRVRARREWQ